MLMDEDGIGEEGRADGVHRREEIRVFHQDLLSPLGMWAEGEERPQHMACYGPALVFYLYKVILYFMCLLNLSF